uniref:L1 transposable element RRM domain-containing protein n=1 Tax=Latimeria chalumnae TaxID=7897 RepID=H3B3I9_LATCH
MPKCKEKTNKKDFFVSERPAGGLGKSPSLQHHATGDTTRQGGAEITLQTLFNTINTNTGRIEKSIAQLEAKIDNLNSRILSVQKRMEVAEEKVTTITDKVGKVEEGNNQTMHLFSSIVKDNLSLSQRLEYLENQVRACNIRILGLVEDNDQKDLGTFLSEWIPSILTSVSLPSTDCITRAFRIPLRETRSEQTCRTVIVKLASEKLRNKILTAARGSGEIIYKEKKILFFPGVSPITQRRRKAFLEYKAALFDIGARVAVLYPAKLRVKWKNQSYIFWDPMQVDRFLANKRSSTQQPVPDSSGSDTD